MPPFDPALQGMPPERMPPEAPPEVPPDGSQQMPVEGLQDQPVQASPEEQAAMEKFVVRAWQLVYSDEMFPQIVEMLKGGGEAEGQGDPVRGLAMATDLVTNRIAKAAEEAGEPLQPDVLYHAGTEVLEDLAEISRVGRIKDYSKDPDGLERAWFEALDLFRNRMQQNGTLDEASMKAGQDELVRADQDGSLERIMRGLADMDKSGQAGGREPPPEGGNMPPPRPRGMGTAMGAR